MKVKKRFDYKGIEIRIVDVEETYLNSSEKMTVRRVKGPNGGIIPVNVQHRQTLKSLQAETLRVLEEIDKRGAYDVKHELTRPL